MSELPSSSSLMLERKREFSYGIFLSFNGKDTRKKFTSHLHSALIRHGVEIFKDDTSLKKGKDFTPELLRAIEESWGSIIVISKTYAFSHWCLDELVEIMKQRKERGHKVYPIFYEVEPADFRHQIRSVKEAFDKHEKRYDEEKTQRWRVALKKVTDIDGWVLKDQCEADFIDDIVKNISKEFDVEVLDEEEVEKLKSTFRTIQAWMVDAENKQLMKQGEVVRDWLDKLKHIAYDINDALEEWNTTILKSKFEKDQAQIPLVSSSSLGLRIKELNKKSQDIIKQKDDFHFTLDLNNSFIDLRLERPKTVSLIEESVVYGRDCDKDALIRLLLCDDNNERGTSSGIPLLAIVGMGGIGKTTLAQLVYNEDKVKKHFDERFWVCVSDFFDEVRIAEAIVETLGGTLSNKLESLLLEIQKRIDGKKFLLVLDDVWTEDDEKWERLKPCLCSGSRDSRILVTTRNKNVASILGCLNPFRLGVLSNEDSWSLFSKIAFSGKSYQDRKSLESIGRKFVEKCAGLPLAVKTLASLLRLKTSKGQWERILKSHLWELDKVENGLFSPLLLSYYDLPFPVRQCFSYCAIFPKDHVIEKDLLIKLWMAHGFLEESNEMEIVGEEYFDDLAARSFFQEFEKDKYDDSIIVRCKMHDIVHDFAQFLRKDECCVVAGNGYKEQGAESYNENVRHLTLIRVVDGIGILDCTFKVKKLRSLVVDTPGNFFRTDLIASLPKLCDQLICLRMLNLCKMMIEVVPQEIGKLIHLRYLSFEENEFLSELPETLCDLYNLQTLNIRNCGRLQQLPYGMEKLINLRHLQNKDTRSLTFFPKGMQRLTSLQTLEEFCVVKKGGNESETSFGLSDLGNLIHLRGNLYLKILGVAEVTEAREARLSTMPGLCSLHLDFYGYDEASFLEALHPPQQLRHLRIDHILSLASPSWMTSLTSLKSVQLSCCDNWESLPPMGKLPSLESLLIEWMREVKEVGEEFVGVETSSSSFVNHNNNIAFPNLKTLQFDYMDEWEEWEYDEKVLRRTTIMPKLQSLSVRDCQKLKTLPRHLLQSKTLKKLEINCCDNLYRRFNRETGDDWSSISHISTVNIFGAKRYSWVLDLKFGSILIPKWINSRGRSICSCILEALQLTTCISEAFEYERIIFRMTSS